MEPARHSGSVYHRHRDRAGQRGQRLVTNTGTDALHSVPSQCPGHSIRSPGTGQGHMLPQTQLGLGGSHMAAHSLLLGLVRGHPFPSASGLVPGTLVPGPLHSIHLVQGGPSQLPINSRHPGSLPPACSLSRWAVRQTPRQSPGLPGTQRGNQGSGASGQKGRAR